MTGMNQNWRSQLNLNGELPYEPINPRGSAVSFYRIFGGMSHDSFVYRTNFISQCFDNKFQRTYVNDILSVGLKYTNDFKTHLKDIDLHRGERRDVRFCDQVMSEIKAYGRGDWRCRGLYMFLSLRDCVVSQYLETEIAVGQNTSNNLAIITRMKLGDLPDGKMWPDVCAPDGPSAAVHVVPHSELDVEPTLIPPNNIQIWFGDWINVPAFDVSQLRADVKAKNLERILFPCDRVAGEEPQSSDQLDKTRTNKSDKDLGLKSLITDDQELRRVGDVAFDELYRSARNPDQEHQVSNVEQSRIVGQLEQEGLHKKIQNPEKEEDH